MATLRPRTPGAPSRRRGDDGFSLVEVLVAIGLIGTVMASLTPFLINSLTFISNNRYQQAAIQLANDALERARSMSPTSLLSGRSLQAVTAQASTAPAAATALLAGTNLSLAYDPSLSTVTSLLGSAAPLPTVPIPVTVNGNAFQQSFYVGKCWQARTTGTSIGTCGQTVTLLPFYRVVVAVTWQNRTCPAGSCAYAASTLVNVGREPSFDVNLGAPTITGPPDQLGVRGVPVVLPVVALGGAAPYTWTATGRPNGLVIDSALGVVSGTPTTAGVFTVVATVTDSKGQTDTVSFKWTIA